MWFTEANVNKIGRIATTGVVSDFSIPTPNSFPLTVATGPDGALWFSENSPAQIGRLTTGGVFSEFPVPVPACCNSFYGVTAGPDGNLRFTFAAASELVRLEVVTTLPTTTTAASSANPSTFGQPVSFTATVCSNPVGPSTPTGTATFTVDGNPLGGPVTLTTSGAPPNCEIATSLPISSLGAGAHAIVATYGGDTGHQGSVSATLSQNVVFSNSNTGCTPVGQT